MLKMKGNGCEENWIIGLFLPVNQKENNKSVTENLVLIYYKEETQQIVEIFYSLFHLVWTDHVNK